MSGPEPDWAGRLAFAVAAAKAAGELTMRWFDSPALGVDTKADGSPVTEADRGAERLVRDEIARAYPADGVLGEEFGESAAENPGGGVRWIVDPIDGTFSFTRGVPLFATLLAAEAIGPDGTPDAAGPAVGVIHLPALGETIYARRGGGAFRETRGGVRPARVSAAERFDDACWAATSPHYFDGPASRGVFDRLVARPARFRGWPDAYAFALVATGRCDAAVEPSLKPWDIAPMLPILEEAGGRFTDWSGGATVHGGSALASNGRLHGELLGIIGGAGGR